MKRTLVCLMVVAACLAAESSWAGAIQVPENGALYGIIPWTEVTWGGSDIPTDYSAYREISDSDSGVTIRLAMRAHGRYAYHAGVYQDPSEPIYYVETGKYGGDGSDKDYAKWNFAFYVAVQGTPTPGTYTVKLFYDFDPGPGTDENSHGIVTVPIPTLFQNSWNLAMQFLNGMGPYYDPNYISLPEKEGTPLQFNPNVNGEYTFRLAVYKDSSDLGGVSIKVNAVPEPTSMVALSSLGLIGGVWGVVRRRKRSQV